MSETTTTTTTTTGTNTIVDNSSSNNITETATIGAGFFSDDFANNREDDDDEDSPDFRRGCIAPSIFVSSDSSIDCLPGDRFAEYQVAAIAIKCAHNSLLVGPIHSRRSGGGSSSGAGAGLWLPYVGMRPRYKCAQMPALLAEYILREYHETVDREALFAARSAAFPFCAISLHSITRIQLPNRRFITRYIFAARWRATTTPPQQQTGTPTTTTTTTNATTASTIDCCVDSENLKWIPAQAIYDPAKADRRYRTLIDRFWGSEVGQYAVMTESSSSSSGTSKTTRSKTTTTTTTTKTGNEYDDSSEAESDDETEIDADENDRVVVKQRNVQFTEIALHEIFKYVKRENCGENQSSSSGPANGTTNATTEMFIKFVSDAKFAANDVAKIYSDFVQHCHPSINMSFASFAAYCRSIGLSAAAAASKTIGSSQTGSSQIKLDNRIELKLERIFCAMNYKVKNFLSFNELLLGLVCLHPESPHSSPRFSFIFRYYDSDHDGTLDRQDRKQLYADIAAVAAGGENVATKTKSSPNSGSSTLNLSQFCDQLQSENLRKSSEKLCRETQSVLRLIHKANVYDFIGHQQSTNTNLESSSSSSSHEIDPDRNCTKCRSKRYMLASHSVRLTQFGRVTAPRAIDNYSSPCENNNPLIEEYGTNMEQQLPHYQSPQLYALARQHSREYIFRRHSCANYVLDVTRRLAGFNARQSDADRRSIRSAVANGLPVSIIARLCDEVSELFAAESRVLRVATPTLVMGDIHGNMHDLLTFEAQLWPMAPAYVPYGVLFLGDYVDRGEFSIEVVCYLFAMKILMPGKFFLLRGNHEVRQIQKVFTFEKECYEKYGSHGGAIYETFNRAFDLLPFAAIIDESIYCAHGGIPCSVTTIDGLNRQPAPISDPEQEAPCVWEILWSDPITGPEYQKLSEFMNKKDGSGYMPNMKRSTAFYFSEIATNAFLKRNKLSHVIRAHEVINEGYKLNHTGHVITIFSCSRYCGGPNKAAAIMIEAHEQDGFIKIISLDT